MKSQSQIQEEIIRQNLKKIAEKEGITEEQVREDILLAISYGLKSDDSKAKEFWKNIPCKGESPTVDETLNYFITNLSKKYS